MAFFAREKVGADGHGDGRDDLHGDGNGCDEDDHGSAEVLENLLGRGAVVAEQHAQNGNDEDNSEAHEKFHHV